MKRASESIDWWLAIGLLLVCFVVLLSLLAPIVSGDPLVQRLDQTLLRPGQGGHVLGTDHLGRDLWSRLVHGARSAVLVALGASFGAGLIGSTAGIVSGMSGSRRVDAFFAVGSDAVLAFPTVLLALVVSFVLGPGRVQVLLTLAVVYSPVVYRVARLATRATVGKDYYRTSLALGSSRRVRVVVHVLPNVLPQIIVQMASLAALSVGTEAALSFLGLGTQPPLPSWGLMLSDARRYLLIAPHMAWYPGIATALLSAGLQLVSDRIAQRIASE